MQIVARASAGAVQGDNFGFVVLRRGSDVRRIPYAFSVSRSSLTGRPVTALKAVQSGDTRTGEDRARVYRWPTSPFSILGIFGVDPSVNDDGKEKLYSLDIQRQAVNAGVVVVRPRPKLNASITALLSSNQPIHPWFMGSLDENNVLGYAGIPVNLNGQLPDFLYSIGAAGGVFLPPGRYYVSVDSGRDLFNGRALAGGDVDLLAVEHVLVAVEHRGGADRGRVRARLGLGDRHRRPAAGEALELLVVGDRRRSPSCRGPGAASTSSRPTSPQHISMMLSTVDMFEPLRLPPSPSPFARGARRRRRRRRGRRPRPCRRSARRACRAPSGARARRRSYLREIGRSTSVGDLVGLLDERLELLGDLEVDHQTSSAPSITPAARRSRYQRSTGCSLT